MTKPLVIAHRGAAGEAPENTLGSFRLALEQGADAIELDVHLSRDGELIVCHDHTIDRTTTGSGAIRELTVSELKRADAGVKFAAAFEAERLPLLEEVFALVPPHVMINVENKDFADDGVAHKLYELLKRTDRIDGVVVSSFNHKSLARLKRLAPEVRVGLLYASDHVNHRRMAEAAGMPVYSLHPHYHGIDAEDIADAAANGIRVYPWTVNGEKDMKRLIAAGASGIITDYPGRLKRLLDA